MNQLIRCGGSWPHFVAITLVAAIAIVSCGGGSASGSPEPTPDEKAGIYAAVVAELCSSRLQCARQGQVEVFDGYLEPGGQASFGPLDKLIRDKISRSVSARVEFVPTGGEEPVIYLGEVREAASGVVLIAGAIGAGRTYWATDFVFAWDGTAWTVTTGEDTGVTVTTSVS